jgi:HSP20 family molecular chaperone IbpA
VDDVTAGYAKGVLTVRVGLREAEKKAEKKVQVTVEN